MRRIFSQIERAAQSDASTLVVGESGTGKELVARALHELGPRRSKPFVIVDCGALAPTLVASELFGHERGAFTGADRQHIGAIERANGGTDFFDEIGELPPALQESLLGVLQRRRFRRLGGRDEIASDIRVVSATHRDLRAEVNASTFRLDLFFRLAVVVLRVPALRDRPEDVPLLVEAFARATGHAGDIGELFSPETLAQLAAQRWSGNVRELQNLIEATIAMGELADTTSMGAGDPSSPADEELLPYRVARDRVLGEFERAYVSKLYARAGGNASLAAREARMDRSHLLDLLRKHGMKS
jgi:DNA-binding NtrC family response regulator